MAQARTQTTPQGDPLASVDLKKIAVQLLAFARRRASMRGFRLVGDGGLADGKTVADVVQDSIVSLYDGSRHWDPARQPDLLEHLKSVVNSKLDHLASSADNRRVVSIDGHPDPVDAADPEQLLAEKRRAELLAAVKNAFLDRIVAEPDLVAYYEAVEALGDDKPAVLAEHLKMPVATINNIKKRIERRLREAYLEVSRAQPQGGRHE